MADLVDTPDRSDGTQRAGNLAPDSNKFRDAINYLDKARARHFTDIKKLQEIVDDLKGRIGNAETRPMTKGEKGDPGVISRILDALGADKTKPTLKFGAGLTTTIEGNYTVVTVTGGGSGGTGGDGTGGTGGTGSTPDGYEPESGVGQRGVIVRWKTPAGTNTAPSGAYTVTVAEGDTMTIDSLKAVCASGSTGIQLHVNGEQIAGVVMGETANRIDHVLADGDQIHVEATSSDANKATVEVTIERTAG